MLQFFEKTMHFGLFFLCFQREFVTPLRYNTKWMPDFTSTVVKKRPTFNQVYSTCNLRYFAFSGGTSFSPLPPQHNRHLKRNLEFLDLS